MSKSKEVMKKIDTDSLNAIKEAYISLLSLGLDFADNNYHWSTSQRRAWERTEKFLRPFVPSKVLVRISKSVLSI